MLGAPSFLDEEMEERTKEPGVAIGLAWTPAGGDVLFIEASRMAGTGTLTLTGQLGEVMKESARAALSWFRAHAAAYGADPDFFKSAEIHLHVPSGAIPKDGPSAGVTMATALASELTRRPVRGDMAMTGEITLSGRVLPVGGIKEKVLAARRAGIREVILPRQNEKNVKEDLTEELRRELTIHYVQAVDEVLLLALLPAPKGARRSQDRPPRAAAHPVAVGCDGATVQREPRDAAARSMMRACLAELAEQRRRGSRDAARGASAMRMAGRSPQPDRKSSSGRIISRRRSVQTSRRAATLEAAGIATRSPRDRSGDAAAVRSCSSGNTVTQSDAGRGNCRRAVSNRTRTWRPRPSANVMRRSASYLLASNVWAPSFRRPATVTRR